MSGKLSEAIWRMIGDYLRDTGHPPEMVVLGSGQYETLLMELLPYDAAVLDSDRSLWGLDVVTCSGTSVPFNNRYVDAREL